MHFSFLLSFGILVFLPYVVAHGYLSQVTIDGRPYRGNVPYDQNGSYFDSIIRRVGTQGPVKGATNPYLSCGLNSTAASLVAVASPGSQISYRWQKAGNKAWDHKDGPIIVSIAQCVGLCRDATDSKGASWVVIAQSGKVGDTFPMQEALFKNQTGTFQLPNVARGQYVVRIEIISLFNASVIGGAEFYPACFQIQVDSGSPTGGVTNSTVYAHYPGSYKDTDPGILDAHVYDEDVPYVIPGPAIATYVGTIPTPTTTPTPAPTPTPSATGPITENEPVGTLPPSTPATSSPTVIPTPGKIQKKRRSIFFADL